MDEGPFSPPNPPFFGNIGADFMDQLLDDGCWLQTAEGPTFSQPLGPSTSRGSSHRPTYPWFTLEGGDWSSSLTTTYLNQSPSLDGYGSSTSKKPDDQSHNSEFQNRKAIVTQTPKSYNLVNEGFNEIMWIGPKAEPGPSTPVKDRLMQAICKLREMNSQRDVLVQIWIPIKKGLTSYLTTLEQPHFCHPTSQRLLLYRNVSEQYEFLADEDTKQALGLPGRVFLGKAPEWTPNVRFFRQEEYPRVEYAHKFDVRGSIALPVFERGTGDCLGVVEIIMTTDNINYRPEVESVCEALKLFNLKSSEIFPTSHGKVGKKSQEAMIPEILNVLKIVCDAYNLPLAQTWAPCAQQGKDGCWHSDKAARCVSTIDSAYYIRDDRFQDFHTACCEHHLLRDQGGIVGKAFETSELCFASDVTEYSKVEYPLSHHAKMCGLRAALAIRLGSIYHESQHYVLEFYLPTDHNETENSLHEKIWNSVFMVVQQHCQSLQFITVNNNSKSSTNFWFSQKKGKEVAVSLDFEDDGSREFSVTHWRDSEPELQLGQLYSDSGKFENDQEICGSSSGGRLPLSYSKGGEKRRTKSQKTISLQTLRQYFAGSLKDAAKSIGVCPTTLKRICRQHGITRWPSRKIKKVGHSLKKLQLVIDSVQGAEGAIKISTFYNNFPQLNKPNSESQLPSMNLNDQPQQQQQQQQQQQLKQQQQQQPENSSFLGCSGGTTSNSASTSSSQTSTSSQCFTTVDDPGGFVKRAQSEAQIQVVVKKESSSSKNIIEIPHNNKLLAERPPTLETLASMPVSRSWPLRRGGALKAKVTFGDEKVRLTIVPNMSFQELQQEIARRFNLDDMRKIGIKYLDDDNEWVLLTCDADLEECIDIYKSSGTYTIKLALSIISSVGGSAGSSGLS